MKNFLINGYIFVVSSLLIVVFLFMSEFVLRMLIPNFRMRVSSMDIVFSEVYGWKIPNYFHDCKVGWRSLNSKGYLGKEYPYERDYSKKRILMLGDSITYGFCVEPERNFSAVMDASSDELEVINLGVKAYGTDQELIRFQHEGLPFNPDIVILNFCLDNDFIDNLLSSYPKYPKPYFTLENGELKLWEAHLKISFLKRVTYELIQHSLLFQELMDLFGTNKKTVAEDFFKIQERITMNRELTFQLIRKIADEAKTHKIDFILSIFPYKECFEKGCPELEQMMQSPTLKGLRIINLLEYLKNENFFVENFNQFVFDRQLHLKPKGHQLISDIYLQYLRDEKLLQ